MLVVVRENIVPLLKSSLRIIVEVVDALVEPELLGRVEKWLLIGVVEVPSGGEEKEQSQEDE